MTRTRSTTARGVMLPSGARDLTNIVSGPPQPEWLTQVALGRVPGASDRNGYGFLDTPLVDTRYDIWPVGTRYNAFFDTAQSLEVVSSSGDNAAAGTGARTVTLDLFDENLVRGFQETVTLNGTTPVAVTGTWRRCFDAVVASAGSYGYTQNGDITIQVSGAGEICGVISEDYNYTKAAIYTVPSDKTGILYGWSSKIGIDKVSGSIKCELQTRSPGGVWYTRSESGDISPDNGRVGGETFRSPLVLEPETDLRIMAIAEGQTNTIYGRLDLVFVS